VSAVSGVVVEPVPEPIPEHDRRRAGRVVVIALSLLGLVLLASLIYPFASALLFAAVLAGAFHPALERLAARLGGRRQAAAALLTLAAVLLLVLPVMLLTVTLGKEVVEGIAYLRQTLDQGGVAALVQQLPGPLRALADRMLGGPERIEEIAGAHTGQAAAAVTGVLVATSGIVFQVAMMVVALFFLLVDGRRLVEWIADTAPLPNGQMVEILTDFRNVSVAVLVSSLATAGAQAAVALVGYLLAGVPQPLFFALVTFIIAFVPALGATSVVLGLALLLLFTGHSHAALFLALWGVLVVGFTDNVVKPLLMRGRMEIHGAVIFFALLGGLATFGPIGLVAGPLILSFFLAVVRIGRAHYLPPK
jgi:predicted PurR-regulated permease PerM